MLNKEFIIIITITGKSLESGEVWVYIHIRRGLKRRLPRGTRDEANSPGPGVFLTDAWKPETSEPSVLTDRLSLALLQEGLDVDILTWKKKTPQYSTFGWG